MKRAADTVPLARRSTRSTTRGQREQERQRKHEQERAIGLMTTPQLCALPAVFRSGFLYQFECIKAAKACTQWSYLWEEAEPHFPECARVQVTVENISAHCQRDIMPTWVLQQAGLTKEILGSNAFVRQIFDKLNILRADAKKTKGQRAKFVAALPVWGKDIHHVTVHAWGPTNRNDGGMAITFGPANNYMVRLYKDLSLWTGIRTWNVYDGEPLWP